ncbi:MAG TPA: class II fructose-bisphosphatase [Candidatus Nanoarchaeia archaeon]|nr:class II fructose-bisphosphatase [Candidatus Nanoarchaeia archaeon]
MDRNLALEFVRVTEAAAMAAGKWVGKGDKKAADKAATEAMRKRFNVIGMDGTVVIGEGERDKAPMLFIGEKIGSGDGPQLDIAVDPLEGTNMTALGGNNAISVLASAPKGTLLHAPDTYMNKIAVGPEAKGSIDLDASVKENIKAVSEKVGKNVEDVTVIILDRERHQRLIKEVRSIGARIRLIGDGDVAGAIATCSPDSGVDMLLGSGGAPEGVIAACAIKCLGGEFQGRLMLQNAKEKERARKMGIKKPDKKLAINDLANSDNVMFAATGVTDGPFLKGVRFDCNGTRTHSVVMRSSSKTIRYIEAIHKGELEEHCYPRRI